MGLAHNTQRLICRVVLRGCCWLRNTRDSQLARGAAARLLCSRVCESGSVATARPCQRTGPSSSSSEFFCSRVPVFESFFCCCGVKQRSVLGTVAPRVCSLQLVPQRRRPAALRVGAERRFPRSPKAEKPRSLRRIDFFFLNCFWKFDFGSFFRDAHLSAAPGSSSSSSSSSCSLKTPTVGARTSLWA